MIDRRAFALAGAASLAACGTHEQGPAAGELRFSVLSTESAVTMGAYWQPILADLERQTGLKVKPYFANNYTLLIEAMRFKKTDAGWFSNLSGLEAVRRGGGEVFARTFDPTGHDGYKSVLIVPASSKTTLADVLKCDRRYSFGMGDVLSTSGTLAPLTYLFAPKDIDPAKCFKLVRSGASHQTNLFAVANGELDVATNNTTSLLLNKEHNRHEADQVRVIWESPMLPEDPIIWRKDLDPAVKEKLRQFFLTYGQGDSPAAVAARGYMAKVRIGGFKPADNSHLLPVREMEATQKLIDARARKDPARIKEAQANLDAITAERVALESRTRTPVAAQ